MDETLEQVRDRTVSQAALFIATAMGDGDETIYDIIDMIDDLRRTLLHYQVKLEKL